MTEKQNKNKRLVTKYPFLGWRGNPLYGEYDGKAALTYDYTWADELPYGWNKAFGEEMWKDLSSILKKARYSKKFQFEQIKEKYGTLRLYYGAVPKSIAAEMDQWEEKYEGMSMLYCINCGQPTSYQTTGYICYICEDCKKEYEKEKYHSMVLPLTSKDIPIYTRFGDPTDPNSKDVTREHMLSDQMKKQWGKRDE